MANAKLGKQTKVNIKQQHAEQPKAPRITSKKFSELSIKELEAMRPDNPTPAPTSAPTKQRKPRKLKPFTQLSERQRGERIAKMSTAELNRRIRKNTEVLNRRFKILKKHGYGDYVTKRVMEVNEYVKSSAKTRAMLTPKQLSKMTRAEKAMLLDRQEQIKHSQYSTISGREKIITESVKTFNEKQAKFFQNGKQVTREQWRRYGKLMDFLDRNGALRQVKDEGYLPSNMVVELVGEYTVNAMISVFMRISDELAADMKKQKRTGEKSLTDYFSKLTTSQFRDLISDMTGDSNLTVTEFVTKTEKEMEEKRNKIFDSREALKNMPKL